MPRLARSLASARIVRVVLLWATCAAAIAILGTGTPSAQQTPDASFVPGEILVRYRPAATEGRRDGLRRAVRSRLLKRFERFDIEHVKLPDDISVAQALSALQGDPDVLSAAPNYLQFVAADPPPNDPYWLASSPPNLYGLVKINAQAAWNFFGTDSSNVVVAMIDTGVNYNHPDLAANIWSSPTSFTFQGVTCPAGTHGMNTFSSPMTCDPMDDSAHGTMTAGIVGAVGNNGIGVVGVNWNVKIMPCKANGVDAVGTSATQIACLNFILDQKVNRGVNVRVINNSWGSYQFDPNIKAAIEATTAAGILNVCAAGNIGLDNDGATPYFPASFTSPGIVSVAASDSDDNLAVFDGIDPGSGRQRETNYGATSVDLAAPGKQIQSTFYHIQHPTEYFALDGTSYAAPHVSGVAARLVSVIPGLTVSELKSLLMSSVDQLPQWSGKVVAGGRLNMYRALVAAYGGSTGPPATAAFVRTDTTTQGSWIGVYGSNGYALANDATSLPSYAQVVWAGQFNYTWAASTTDPRALRRPAGTDRIAATWYSGTSYTIDVNITDGATHQVALYNLDWDAANTRAQRVDVLNPATGAVLDTRTVTSFSNGQYLVWTIGGYVRFRVTNMGGWNAVVSGLFFNPPATPGSPTITTSPASQTITSGQAATLSVVATGTAPLAYQWYVGTSGTTTTPIAGATASSYTTPALTTTTNYWVRVSNGIGTANSATATITIAAPPSITTQPASQTITSGQTATLSVVATGTAPFTYQWYVGTSGTTTTPIAGATASSYTTAALTANTNYWVRVSNQGGTANSATATITVVAAVPGTAAFVRTDTTTQGSWMGVYGSNGYALANDATSLPSYAQVVWAGQSSHTWAASTTDTRALRRPAGTDRIAATWYTGTSYTIDVNITDGATHQVALYNLDWDSGNVRAQRVDVLHATTGAVLDTRTVTAFSNGQYLVWTIGGHVTFRVTNTSSWNAVVSGLFFGPGASGSPPTITTSPASQSIASGQTATMSVVATGTAPLAYQWYVGPSGTTTTPIAGATASSYTTPALTTTTSYWVRVSNAVGTADSATATITVPGPPSITTQPASQTITSGQAATLSVVATGAPLTYQWYVGTSGTTTAPIAGATTSSYTTPALTTTTNYWVRVSNGIGPTNSATATITVAAAGSNTAAFVRTDTTTQGSWIGAYGSNGYALANDATSLPSYAQAVWAGQLNHTWAASTTDPRALRRPSGTDRIAATWYSGTSYTIDVNITDGATHQAALYNLDWDGGNARAQRVDVLNATTGAVLDTRTVTAFSNGQYLVWTIGGHVTFRVTNTGPANAVVSGLFFDPPASPGSPSITTQPASQTITSGQAATLSVVATGTAPLSYQWYVGTSGTTTAPIAGATTSSYTTPALTATTSYWVRVSNGIGPANSATATITVVAGGGTTAAFVGTDTTSLGSWIGVYGGRGYVLASDATAVPSYAQVSFAGQLNFIWAASTTDPRALQRPPAGTDRIAATWYTDTSFTIDVNITDGALHQVALYNLDWNGANTRVQRVDVLDATTGAVLDNRTVTAFTNGKYLVWNIGGHVTLRVTNTGPSTVAVSGLFFN